VNKRYLLLESLHDTCYLVQTDNGDLIRIRKRSENADMMEDDADLEKYLVVKSTRARGFALATVLSILTAEM
jgi:hypothetical protein